MFLRYIAIVLKLYHIMALFRYYVVTGADIIYFQVITSFRYRGIPLFRDSVIVLLCDSVVS